MSQTVAASPRLTSQTIAEIVAVARAQRVAAQRSRADARSHVVQAERNYHAALARGEEAIRLRWAARSIRFDAHGTVDAIWPPGGQPDEMPVPAGLSRVTLDRLVSQLFEVGLAVSACRGMVDGQVGPRLESVIDTLDSMIRDIRQAAFDVQDAQTPGPAGASVDDPPGVDPTGIQHDGLVRALRRTSVTVEKLWRLASNEEREAAVALGEASQSLYRALVVLDGSGPG